MAALAAHSGDIGLQKPRIDFRPHAPIVVGHPDTDVPAYGWVDSFDFDTSAEQLFATVGCIDPAVAEMVQAGRFRKVSMAYLRPHRVTTRCRALGIPSMSAFWAPPRPQYPA